MEAYRTRLLHATYLFNSQKTSRCLCQSVNKQEWFQHCHQNVNKQAWLTRVSTTNNVCFQHCPQNVNKRAWLKVLKIRPFLAGWQTTIFQKWPMLTRGSTLCSKC